MSAICNHIEHDFAWLRQQDGLFVSKGFLYRFFDRGERWLPEEPGLSPICGSCTIWTTKTKMDQSSGIIFLH